MKTVLYYTMCFFAGYGAAAFAQSLLYGAPHYG